MSEFVDCRTCKTNCVRNDGNYGYTFCDKYTHTPMSNADRIRSMSDEELSEFINPLTVCDCCSYDGICSEYNNIPKCRKGVLEWLQKPAEKQKEDTT